MAIKDIVDQHLVWTRQSPEEPERTQYKVKPPSMVAAADESIDLRRVGRDANDTAVQEEEEEEKKALNPWVYDHELRTKFPGMAIKDIVDQHLVWTRQSPEEPERTQYKVKPPSMVAAADASDEELVDESIDLRRVGRGANDT